MALIPILIIIIVAVVWFAWPRRVSKETAPGVHGDFVNAPAVVKTASRKISSVLAPVTGRVQRLRLPWHKENDWSGQLGQWVKEANLAKRLAVYKRLPEDAADFSDWVGGLSRDDLAEFTHGLADQCHALGFELGWLLDPTIPRDLRRSLEDPVLLCSLATWKARESRALAAFVAWQQAPDRPENRAFARAMYARLVGAGLITPPANMLLAPDSERHIIVVQAIRSTAAEQPSAFLATAREVVDQSQAAQSH